MRAHLGDAADVRDVGLQDVHAAALEEGAHLPPAVEPLAQGDRAARLRSQRLDAARVLGQQRLLDEQRSVRLERPRELLGHGLVHAAVEVDAGVHAEGSHRLDALDAAGHGGRRVEPAQVLGRVHLHCREALRFAG